jgi:hypothetical protein
MGLDKYLSLISTKRLFLARADQMVDPWEGRWPDPKDVDAIKQRNMAEILMASLNNLRQSTYLSCWFASEHESAGMWSLYASEHNGVALRTTWGALTSSLIGNEAVVGGKVMYVAYDNPKPEQVSPYDLFFYKRLSFKHEEEVRLMIVRDIRTRSDGVIVIQAPGKEPPVGVPVQMRLEHLAPTVFVSPRAAQWFVEVVRSVTDLYGLEDWDIRQSSLYNVPW